MRLGFCVFRGQIPRGVSTWNSSFRDSSSTWTRHVEFGHVDLESLRLDLLKVKPSLRDSSFKGLLLLPRVMSGWSCVAVWSCQLLSVLRHIQIIYQTLCWQQILVSDLVNQFREYILIAQATKTCLRPCEPILSVQGRSQ